MAAFIGLLAALIVVKVAVALWMWDREAKR
jgi:hypothetical protein